VNTKTDNVFQLVVNKAREILMETPKIIPVIQKGKDGKEDEIVMEPLCSHEAISAIVEDNKLRNEIWFMNNLDDEGKPTEKTDAFMCFGTLDFGALFYLNKEEEGAEDFQKKVFKEKVREGKVNFANANQNKKGEYITDYLASEDATIPWFDGFLDDKDVPKKYDNVCMLHWVAKKAESNVKRLFGVAETVMKSQGYRYIFLQVGCKDQTKLANYYNSNGVSIVMLVEEKKRGKQARRNSVIIKANAMYGFVFWGWKDMSLKATTVTGKKRARIMVDRMAMLKF